MDHFLDPEFEYHRAIGLVWLNIALQLVTTPLVPYNVTDYGEFMKWSADTFAQSNEQHLLEHNISLSEYIYQYEYWNFWLWHPLLLGLLNASVESFIKACTTFQMELDHAQERQLKFGIFLEYWLQI